MIDRIIRLVIAGCMSAAILSCSSSTEPTSSISAARRSWLLHRPLDYEFEESSAGAWFPRSGFRHVQVSDGRVVMAVDSSGKTIPNYTTTIDSIWNRLLAAQSKGRVFIAAFDRDG